MRAMHDSEVRSAVSAVLEAHTARDTTVCTPAEGTLQALAGVNPYSKSHRHACLRMLHLSTVALCWSFSVCVLLNTEWLPASGWGNFVHAK